MLRFLGNQSFTASTTSSTILFVNGKSTIGMPDLMSRGSEPETSLSSRRWSLEALVYYLNSPRY